VRCNRNDTRLFHRHGIGDLLLNRWRAAEALPELLDNRPQSFGPKR
jgi:hypothetical protein